MGYVKIDYGILLRNIKILKGLESFLNEVMLKMGNGWVYLGWIVRNVMRNV